MLEQLNRISIVLVSPIRTVLAPWNAAEHTLHTRFIGQTSFDPVVTMSFQIGPGSAVDSSINFNCAAFLDTAADGTAVGDPITSYTSGVAFVPVPFDL